MAMLLSLLPCSGCVMPMKDCIGCTQFFQWLDVAIVHQGRTKGFKNSEAVLDLTQKRGWNVASAVEAFYINEQENAKRILSEVKCDSEVEEFRYSGEKPFYGPASEFTMHQDELRRLDEEYRECVTQFEKQKVKKKKAHMQRVCEKSLALTTEQLLGPLGQELKVAGRPIGGVVFPKVEELVG